MVVRFSDCISRTFNMKHDASTLFYFFIYNLKNNSRNNRSNELFIKHLVQSIDICRKKVFSSSIKRILFFSLHQFSCILFMTQNLMEYEKKGNAFNLFQA